MKIIEIVQLNKELLDKLSRLGIETEDGRWAELYADYRSMLKDGKVTWAVAVLSERYGVCERKIYQIIRKMEKDCTIGAG
jgi:hypothetical protein